MTHTFKENRDIIHVAVGYQEDLYDEAGVVGLWPLRPLCGAANAHPGHFYRGQDTWRTDYADPCEDCFNHEDFPLILLGALP